MAMIGMGESESGDRALESVHEALSSPLLDLDISDAKGALINISGSSDLTLHESEKIVQIVADKLDPEANIIWGAQIDDSLQNTIRTTIVISGVRSHYIYNDRAERIGVSQTDSSSIKTNSDPEEYTDPLDDFIDGTF